MNRSNPVYGRVIATLLVACSLLAPAQQAVAQSSSQTILEARDALRKKDRSRLAAARAVAQADQHPLTQWVEYWELSNRLASVQQDEIEAFYDRWKGTYVEDRLRNDWLLELGHRHDWRNFAADYPRFRMNDDREVTLLRAADRAPVRQGRSRRGARSLVRPARRRRGLRADGSNAARWQAVHVSRRVAQGAPGGRRRPTARSAPGSRPARCEAGERSGRCARHTGALSGPFGRPARPRPRRDGDARADRAWRRAIPRRPQGNCSSDGSAICRRTWRRGPGPPPASRRRSSCCPPRPGTSSAQRSWPPRPGCRSTDPRTCWPGRRALRCAATGTTRWPQVQQAIVAMSPAEQRDPSWVYWRARAIACAGRRPRGNRQRGPARPGPGAARLDRRAAALLRQPGGRGSGAEDRAAAAPGAADRRGARRRRCSTPG